MKNEKMAMIRNMSSRVLLVVLVTVLLHSVGAFGQIDRIRTGTGLGVEKPRVAVADFKIATADPLQKVFNDTLFSDLESSGILEVVSKSMYPLQQPGTPQEVQLAAWANDPTKAAYLAFGNMANANGDLAVSG